MPARNADPDSLYRPDSSADLIAAGALSGSPESNGGAGLYSMPSWIVWAVVSPAISAATVSPKSISEVTPPAVITLPSRTTLPCSCVALTRGNKSVNAQWVVARRPLSIPATPKMNAPVQTDVTCFAAPACRRTNSTVSRSPIARRHRSFRQGRRANRVADSSQRCALARGPARNRWAPARLTSQRCGSLIEEGVKAPAEAQ